MRYLLDTNAMSDAIRYPRGRIMRRVRQIGDAQICTSIIVAAELRFGVAKRGSAQLAARLAEVLARIPVLPFEAPADAVYGELRARIERRGRPMGSNDLLIAAHAIALRVTLVSDNEREFAHVTELSFENWLREA